VAAHAHAVHQKPSRHLDTTKPAKATFNGTVTQPIGRSGGSGEKTISLEKNYKELALKTDN